MDTPKPKPPIKQALPKREFVFTPHMSDKPLRKHEGLAQLRSKLNHPSNSSK